MSIQSFLLDCQRRVDTALDELLPSPEKEPKKLHEAMRYSTLNGGKRLRSALIYATGEALGATPKVLDHVSAAVEMIQAFSLIHDDLPALDNDSLRRGKPSCHKQFDEATAVLAGDTLQALPFEILSNLDKKLITPATKIKMLNLLANTLVCGLAGEALDIDMVNQTVTIEELAYTYQLKTGRFVSLSVLFGALAANCDNKNILNNLKKFSELLGLAFQIHDDIVGVTTETEILGKPQGSDVIRNKPTYPSILGVTKAIEVEEAIIKKSMSFLQKTKLNTEKIAAIATYIIQRKY